MENMALKIKFVTLWVFVAVAHSCSGIISFMMPGVIEDMIAGTHFGTPISEGILVFAAFLYWLIPLTMALLSLMLKDSLNRWANMVVGIVLAAAELGSLFEGQLALTLITIWTTVVLALIVWHAWKWPKQEA